MVPPTGSECLQKSTNQAEGEEEKECDEAEAEEERRRIGEWKEEYKDADGEERKKSVCRRKRYRKGGVVWSGKGGAPFLSRYRQCQGTERERLSERTGHMDSVFTTWRSLPPWAVP